MSRWIPRQCPDCDFATLTRVALVIHEVVNGHFHRSLPELRNAPEFGRWRFRNAAPPWDAIWLFFGGGLVMSFVYLRWGVSSLDHWAQDPLPLALWAAGLGLSMFGFLIGMRDYDRVAARTPYGLPAEDLLPSASPDSSSSSWTVETSAGAPIGPAFALDSSWVPGPWILEIPLHGPPEPPALDRAPWR